MRLTALCALLLSSASALAAPAPSALDSDPPIDVHHPARMAVVRIPSHGVRLNGVLYIAAGAGAHPTAVLFHGLPGNEQNLDVAQALRRAGWNVLVFHYRGSWGVAGSCSYHHLVEDGAAALGFVRSGSAVAAYGIDTQRIVLIGHGSGGFVAATTAADGTGVAGLILVSGTDDADDAVAASRDQSKWRSWVRERYGDGNDTLSGCTPDGLAREVLRQAPAWSFTALAPHLVHVPSLLITSDDGYAADAAGLVAAVAHHGGSLPPPLHMSTDHVYSDHRIALQSAILDWLQNHAGNKPE